VSDLDTKMMPVDEYAKVIGDAMIITHLFGRLTVSEQLAVAVGGPDKNTRIQASESGSHRPDSSSLYFADVDEIPTAFEKALKYMLDKNLMTSAEFKKLDKAVRKYAFSVADVDSKRLLDLLKTNLSEALESGALNVEQWLQQVGGVFQSAGMTKLNDYHLRTVFRTNMQTALNEGRFEMIQDANEDEFPLIEFVAIMDDRTRQDHANLDGFRAPKDDPIWQKITPPLDYNCRCTLRPVHVDEGLDATKTVPDLTDVGFG